MKKKELLAVIIGGTVEWFDYLLYAFLAPVFAIQFFPSVAENTALILSFVIFAGGFLARPIGGIIVGYIGDHYGRRKALLLTISVMCLSTLGMALLPTYQSIGVFAPILLAATRLIQGLAVSGELNTAAIYLAEKSPLHKKCFYTSLTSASACFGICLGTLVTFCAHHFMIPQNLYSWGWRIPFLLATLLGLISGVLRYFSSESTEYKKIMHKIESSINLKYLLIKYKVKIIRIIILSATLSVGNYFLFGFINHFVIKYTGIEKQTVLLINFLSILVMTLFIPMVGYIADRIGTDKIFKIGLSGLAFSTIPIFIYLSHPALTSVILAELVYIIFLSMVAATLPYTMAKEFPIEVRNTAGALAYNISQAIFGGTAPALALWMSSQSNYSLSPAVYLSIVAMLSFFVCQYCFTEKIDNHSEEEIITLIG